MHRYPVIVIGGGHAGVEAACAAASILATHCGGPDHPRARVALVTMDPAKVGVMSCNPAIGGLAKGQIVREIDALGGVMGLAADASGIMFKVLNASKGPAVRGPRAQCDKHEYARQVQRLVAERTNIELIAGTVDELLVEHGGVEGAELRIAGVSVTPSPDVRAASGSTPGQGTRRLLADAVVLTTGTFMRALMHTGERRTPGGRAGEESAVGISAALRALGFELGRLKTGTPPRLRRGSIDWEALPPQEGDDRPTPFSDLSPEALPGGRLPRLPQVECRISSTSPEIHAVVRANLHRAPMYSGQIEAECGPRYCPSLEDKVVRFADRERHHVFLEPESLSTDEIYCNGISTSLPADVQEAIVRGMPGCGRAEIIRHGYAVEYDMVWPHQIDATCEAKRVAGLFLAGQINGTSGYEEAAGQGLVAGINAAHRALGLESVRLARSDAYIGVMMDDLVTRTPREPYRMFTSRAEHRLLLRADNAAERLGALGRRLGLVDDRRWRRQERRRLLEEELRRALAGATVDGRRLLDLVRRPETRLESVLRALDGVAQGVLAGEFDADERARAVDKIMNDVRYEGYVVRARAEIRRQAEAERMRIPAWLAEQGVPGLRAEAAQALRKFRPATVGQAARLAGVNPADVTLILVAIRRGPATARSAC